MTKESVIKVVNSLPDEFDLDEILEKLIFMAKVEKGAKQLDEGKGIPLEEAIKISKTWSK
jgi:hypothetical protein